MLTADEIARLLPHRYPFFLLDRVVALDPGTSAEAIKNISVADPVLAGHFPGRMIYPGVLLIECVAQLAAVIYGTAAASRAGGDVVGDMAHRVGYPGRGPAGQVPQARLPGRPGPVPGPQRRAGGQPISVTGQASVGRDIVMTAKLAVTERDQED